MRQHVWFEPLPWQPPADITRCGSTTPGELTAAYPGEFAALRDRHHAFLLLQRGWSP